MTDPAPGINLCEPIHERKSNTETHLHKKSTIRGVAGLPGSAVSLLGGHPDSAGGTLGET